jgi:hypothetical protein
MGAAVDFEQVLDQKLAAVRPIPPAPPPRLTTLFPATPDPGLRLDVWRGGTPADVTSGQFRYTPVRVWDSGATNTGAISRRLPGAGSQNPAVRGPRKARLLDALQRVALDRLRAAGAMLSEDFTPGELRRAYRVLALQLHPDRYHHGTALDRKRMATQFSEVASAYRVLSRLHS